MYRADTSSRPDSREPVIGLAPFESQNTSQWWSLTWRMRTQKVALLCDGTATANLTRPQANRGYSNGTTPADTLSFALNHN
ncbi:hypothetical protein M404DRAFT_992113 [Pisolithus tinctorius Marx 270]|uniref:Uncharacterized protein n=1 Tax=Pisolithus tinctorius Marx 270 TaxID=870435 RepID=A0A0C3PWY4_PISTI|nr:hypothetical protein M404DRAFT_992113 [Pisolithus tinctorius Marx 270]